MSVGDFGVSIGVSRAAQSDHKPVQKSAWVCQGRHRLPDPLLDAPEVVQGLIFDRFWRDVEVVFRAFLYTSTFSS